MMESAKIYLFGASVFGKEAYHNLKAYYDIIGFIDNDEAKWGKEIFDGKKVMPLANAINDDYHIFITSQYAFEISNQLSYAGIEKYSIYPCLEFSGGYDDIYLCQRINLSAKRLFLKFKDIVIDKLNISDYNKRYLASKTWTDFFTYSCILYTILSKRPEINNFLDYGGGSGLLSLLAIEFGLRDVYYNDIYDISCKDAWEIASVLGYKRKAYIEGDVDNVIRFCEKTGILFDAVGSYDVIEHIYDLESHFKVLGQILSSYNIVCMESGANVYDKDSVDNLALGHLKVEYLDRDYVYGHKERDSLKSYFNLRKDIIYNFTESNNLNELEIIGLAFLTKGMVKSDIENSVEQYLNTGELPMPDPYGIFHHNTCDPLTGNWQEHLIDFNKLQALVEQLGYSFDLKYRGKKENSKTVQVVLSYL